MPRSPFAICRRIRPIVISAFERRAFRARSHVSGKISKYAPTCTYHDSPRAIIGIFFISRIGTTLEHGRPYMIQRMPFRAPTFLHNFCTNNGDAVAISQSLFSGCADRHGLIREHTINRSDKFFAPMKFANRLSYPRLHRPRRFLRDADFLSEPNGGYIRFSQHSAKGLQPPMKRRVTAFHDRVCPAGKIEIARIAAIKSIFAHRDPFAARADWAADAVRPQARLQVEPRRFGIGEQFENLKGADGDFIVHGVFPKKWRH